MAALNSLVSNYILPFELKLSCNCCETLLVQSGHVVQYFHKHTDTPWPTTTAVIKKQRTDGGPIQSDHLGGDQVM